MSDLGALLRKAREQRGYTLDDIQEVTKIRKRYLEAIETGDYKVLPGSFYVRAFVKTYAETVGLDAEEVLRLYQKELPKPAGPETAAAEPRMKPPRRSGSAQHSDRWGKVTVTLLMWLFPLLIVAVIYIYLAHNSAKGPDQLNPGTKITDDTGTPPASTTGSPSAAPSTAPSESATPSAAAVTFKDNGMKGTVRLIEVGPAGMHKLQLDIDGDCWIDVKEKSKNGKVLLSKNFKAAEGPQSFSYDLSGPLYFNIGRADHAAITIDGTLFGDGDAANRARFLFTPAAAP